MKAHFDLHISLQNLSQDPCSGLPHPLSGPPCGPHCELRCVCPDPSGFLANLLKSYIQASTRLFVGPPCVRRPGNGQSESAHTQTQENLKMKTNGRISWSQRQHRGAMRKERVSAITPWRKTPPSQAINTKTKHTHPNSPDTKVQPSTCIHFNGTK